MRAKQKKILAGTEATAKVALLVVGCGNMGGALARGVARTDLAADVKLFLLDKVHAKAEALRSELAGRVDTVSCASWRDVPRLDVIVLAVKPQDLKSDGFSAGLKAATTGKPLVVTLLAAVMMESMREFVGKCDIVRAMPNIPAMVGQAATAMAASEACSETSQRLAERIFSGVGKAYWTLEKHLDAVTGLSGSGPAYVYMVIEALSDGGVKMGLPRELALSLATQTVLGSAHLVQATGLHPAVLRDQVTTPGGTTINAIHELERHGLRAMLISAVATATERAQVLRQH